MVGQVLGVHVVHADHGGQQGMVDGTWSYPDGRAAALEVTSAESSAELAAEAQAHKRGEKVFRSGAQDLDARLKRLLTRLAEPWAGPNIAKLDRTGAEERHLYLWGRGSDDDVLFSSMVDRLPTDPLPLPEGLTDMWLDGWVFRGEGSLRRVEVVRYNQDQGWSVERAQYDEAQLPRR